MPELGSRRVMVTGGAGFIGSHLCERLLTYGPERIVVVDDFSLGKKRNMRFFMENPRVKIYTEDASDSDSMTRIMKKEDCDIVFNLAVIPLPRSLEQPKETFDVNTRIATTLCELLRQGLYRTLIHCSSSEAYGTALYVPMDERHPEKPLTPYAASKIASDHAVISFRKTFGLDAAIARPFNTYGPRQNEGSYAGVIPLTIKRILRGGTVVIFGDGLQTRDYTYVNDIVEGIIGVFRRKSTRGEIINLASGREVSIKALMQSIISIMDYRGKVIHKPARPGDVRRHRGDISLARRLLGYQPRTDLSDGLKATIDWYRRHSHAS